MRKLIHLSIDGNFQSSFTITAQSFEDSIPLEFINGEKGNLPANLNIRDEYRNWQFFYKSLTASFASFPLNRLLGENRATNISATDKDYQSFDKCTKQLISNFNTWLKCEEFGTIESFVRNELELGEENRILILSDDPWLRKLPWHGWNIIKDFPETEVGFGSQKFKKSKQFSNFQDKVKILVILGHQADVESQGQAIAKLDDNVEVTWLKQPQIQELDEPLWKQHWDILFFIGHGESQDDWKTGTIRINENDKITIAQLRNHLKKAIDHGLKLAIFNCCDGLGLAYSLAEGEELYLPQIIVMREELPVAIAPRFLQYFLEEFTKDISLYATVRETRRRLQLLEKEFPYASGLPVICQNPAEYPVTWNQLKKISALSIKKETRNIEKIANIQNLLPGRQEFQNRRGLLSQVKAESWGLLEKSLQNAVLINLHKENEQNSVKQSWDVEVKIGNKKNRETVKSSIIEIFDRESIAGRLLILGVPGAGKTTTLLELAQELIKRAENDANEPIPVLFNLSSWQDNNQTIFQWLIQELKIKYGVPQKVGKTLLQEQQLSLLLDGLDELASERQKKCVQAINQFMESEKRPLYIVVCSRSEEYKLWKTPLKLNGAFCLSSLTHAQIQQYLTRVKLSDLWEKINKFPVILELIETPLFLSMMTMAYESLSIDEWGNYTTKETCREYLLKVYVERMLTRKIKNLWYPVNKEPKIGEVKYWLSWLANYLKFSSEFYIENLQPNCLENKTHKIIYLTLTNDSLWIKIYSLMVILLLSFVVGFLVLFNLNITAFTAFTGGVIFIGGLCVYFDWELWLIFSGLISLVILFPYFFSFLLSTQVSKVIFYFALVLFPFVYSLAKALLILILHFKYNKSNNWLKKYLGKNYVIDISKIYILDSLKWSWDDAKKNFMGIFDMGISEFEKFAGVLTALIFSVVSQLPRFLKEIQPLWPTFSFIFNLLIGVAMLLGFIATITGIFHGLRVREFELEEKRFPNQGIYYSLKNTIRIVIFYTVPSSLFFSIFSLYFFILSSINNLEIYANRISNVFLDGCLGIIFGFILSMVIGINGNKEFPITQGKGFQSAKVVIQHFILRLLLWFNGRIPWNYARFLNYATERMLLQKVGGRYRFIHRFLQEYFANMKFN